jgi:hypothetical protein
LNFGALIIFSLSIVLCSEEKYLLQSFETQFARNGSKKMENAFTNVFIILCGDHFYIYSNISLIGNIIAPYCTSRVRGWGRGERLQ